MENFDVSAMSLPAKHVGGDYYDFLKIPDGRIGIAIADVAGKGVPAAILTATTRSYLQSETQHPSSTLAQTVERINRMVHRDVTNDMYVTMAMAYLTPATGEVEYVNAGHSHPILFHAAGGTSKLDVGGLFLGMFEGATYESAHFTMEDGDVLLLDTDGVTDIQNDKKEVFGTERVEEIVHRNMHLSAEGIRNEIFAACQRHRGDADQFDDFTMIVLKRNRALESGLELDDDFEFD
jgi:sigma-B regulation protein RsbU (phosphoserine phosphatase)